MKTKTKIILSLSALSFSLLGIGGAVTYAGYREKATLLGREIGSDGTTRALFLFSNEARVDLGNAGATLWVRVWKTVNNVDTGIWIKSNHQLNGNYVFHIPTNPGYTNVLFARVNPAYDEPEGDSTHIWNQTANLTINWATDNRFNATGYDNGTIAGSWWGNYNPYSS